MLEPGRAKSPAWRLHNARTYIREAGRVAFLEPGRAPGLAALAGRLRPAWRGRRSGKAFLPSEALSAFLKLDEMPGQIMWAYSDLMLARMKRLLPQYRDLIAFAFDAQHIVE